MHENYDLEQLMELVQTPAVPQAAGAAGQYERGGHRRISG